MKENKKLQESQPTAHKRDFVVVYNAESFFSPHEMKLHTHRREKFSRIHKEDFFSSVRESEKNFIRFLCFRFKQAQQLHTNIRR
jgi:hypothetical protein